MRRSWVVLIGSLMCAAAWAAPADFAGDWAGTLDVGMKLRIVVHLTASDGAWSGTMDSVDQSAKGIPIETVTVQDSSLTLDLPAIKGRYQGTLSDDGTQITGTWSQAGGTWPLNFTRGDATSIPGPNRPQEPKPPLPYNAEDVTYSNAKAGITLAGTFTEPHGKGPFPAVLLITGSGPQDRDEAVMTHKPFLVLSDYLTRQGIAVLRVDDRGVGKSTGTYRGSTTDDFVDDAMAGVAYLKTRKDVDSKHIGLVGHSEGGIIAPIVATRSKDIAFIVLLAGTGVPLDEVLMRQTSLIIKANGGTDDMVKFNEAASRRMFAVVRAETDSLLADQKLHAVADSLVGEASRVLPEHAGEARANIEGSIAMLNSPWFRYLLAYDPAATLRRVKVPVLALDGSLDLQVDPKQNLPVIEKALKAGGNRDVTCTELPGLNHLFQTATTGSPNEYAKIEETMSPVAMKMVSDWILAHSAPKKK